MKKIIIFTLFLCVSCASLNQNIYNDNYNKIQNEIIKILESNVLKQTKIGIKVVSLNSGKVIFEQDSEKLFNPASNLKLITSLVALKVLKPEYKFKTEIFSDLPYRENEINNLYIKGSGDPSLNYFDLFKISLYLSKKIKKITGDIIADTSYFDNIPLGKGWMWDDNIEDYSAPISSLNLNNNCIDIYLNSGINEQNKVKVYIFPFTKYADLLVNLNISYEDNITIERKTKPNGDLFLISGTISNNFINRKLRCSISNPVIYTLTVLKEVLEKNGIKVSGDLKEDILPKEKVLLISHESSVLTHIINFFLKESDNHTGECLLKTLGATLSIPGTSNKGVKVIEKFLKEIGIEENSYRVVDGSGLSRYNLVSPSLFIKILEYAYKDFSIYPEYISALPISGIDGTLKDRMKGDRCERKVRAKTGTMSGISCISGYLSTKK